MANQKNKGDYPDKLVVEDEPGMAERFQRALRKALNTPPKHRTAIARSKLSASLAHPHRSILSARDLKIEEDAMVRGRRNEAHRSH